MEPKLDFINKTETLPNVFLVGLGKDKVSPPCNSYDCRDDCIYECGNCEEGDYDWNPNCFDCYHDCDDCDCADCYYDCDCRDDY